MRNWTRGRQLVRALRLLRVLTDGRLHALAELADAMAVTRRTIRRDMDMLTEAGFVVERDTSGAFASHTATPTTVFQLVNPRDAMALLAWQAIQKGTPIPRECDALASLGEQ